MIEQTKTKWLCLDLPPSDYSEVWDLQGRLVTARKEGVLDSDLVLVVEHPPVFTLGRRGGLSNLYVSEEFLKASGIQVVQIERGGDITFHGPGQLVMYPIVDLHKARLGVTDYVEALEEVMIRVAGDWGIEAQRNGKNRGVWVEEKKLGSIGIAVRRGITFHGMALNANVSFEPFDWIKPCGLSDVKMTSMQLESSHNVSMDQVRKSVKRHVEGVFEVVLVEVALSELNASLKQTTEDDQTG